MAAAVNYSLAAVVRPSVRPSVLLIWRTIGTSEEAVSVDNEEGITVSNAAAAAAAAALWQFETLTATQFRVMAR